MPQPSTLSLLKQYCNLDTSREDGRHYSAVIDLIEPVLRQAGFSTRRIIIPEQIAEKPNRINLIANLDVNKNLPTLLIYNHIDVVPADYPGAFECRIKNGRVFARGAADHKGSTVAVLEALQLTPKDQLRFNLIFLLTTDEETEQIPQLKYLEQFLEIQPEHSLCFDPDCFAQALTSSYLSAYQFTIQAKGVSVHSGISHLGKNAVEMLLSLQPLLADLKKNYQQKVSSLKTIPENGKSEMVRSSFNTNIISGGIASNVIPDLASITIDVRFSPELDVHQERQFILSKLEKAFHQTGNHFMITDESVLCGCFSNHPEAGILEQIVVDLGGLAGQYCALGSSPAAQWTAKLGIPHFGIGVARYDSNIHSKNESCLVDDISLLSEIFQRYLLGK